MCKFKKKKKTDLSGYILDNRRSMHSIFIYYCLVCVIRHVLSKGILTPWRNATLFYCMPANFEMTLKLTNGY